MGRISWLFACAAICFCAPAWGFEAQRGIVLSEQVNEPAIHSVHIGLEGWPLAPPIIELHRASVSLLFTFDCLDTPSSRYEYTVVHCDAAWSPSDLFPADYISGFTVNSIPYPELSLATTTPFEHHALRIPNSDMQIKLSGNYALVVFRAEAPQTPIIVRHFMVVEPLVPIRLTLHPVAGERRASHQRIEIKLGVSRLGTAQTIAQHMTVIAKQNWYGACEMAYTKPTAYEADHALVYGNPFTGIWPGGNEWRMLNLQSLRVPFERVERIDLAQGEYHVRVRTDESLARFPLHSNRDLDGYWALGYAGDWKHSLGANSYQPLESDYAWVYFTYQGEASALDAQAVHLQIAGLGAEGRGLAMRYNPQEAQYELRIRLKQGVYSYRYLQKEALRPERSEQGADSCLSPCQTEGCHYATGNEYHALAYYRGVGERYDRLVGWGQWKPSDHQTR